MGKNGGSGGGEARQCFKETIGEIGHALAEEERHGTKKRYYQPRNADDEHTIVAIGFVLFVFSGGDDEDESRQQGDKGGERHTENVQSVIKIGHGKHCQHEETFDEQ